MGFFSLIGQIILGWLLADFLTGIFHWWEDEVGNEKWPLIGSWIIKPNRLHHSEPLAFTKGSFLDRNLAAIITALIIGIIWWLFVGVSVIMVVTLVGAALANEVHYLAHCPSKGNRVTKVLQKIGIFQSPKEHAQHHRPPFKIHFCVLTDWLNPILEEIRFWKLARMISPSTASLS